MKIKILLFILILIQSLCSCYQDKMLIYPFVASPEQQKFIIDNFEKIKLGFSVQELKEILGEPDEVLSLYEPQIKNPKQVGHTYWYILQRLCDDCSQLERKEKLVRVSFDMHGAVIAIDHWGLKDLITR